METKKPKLRSFENVIKMLCKRYPASKNRLENVQWYPGYCEPNEPEPGNGIVLSNWNNVDEYDKEAGKRFVLDDGMKYASKLFEKLGYCVEWEDEWSSCSDCGNIVRTSPDSYAWKPYFEIGDGELVCRNCVEVGDKSEVDRVDIIQAHYLFCSLNYRGQTCPLYRRMCEIKTRFKLQWRNPSYLNLEPNARALFDSFGDSLFYIRKMDDNAIKRNEFNERTIDQ
jgi:hypothetical protein